MSKENLGDFIESLTPEEAFGIEEHELTKEWRERVHEALLKLRAADIDIVMSIAEAAAHEVRERELDETMKEMEEIARRRGFDIDELVQRKAEKLVAEQTGEPIRFQHPKNKSLTWTGRGRIPRWLKDIQESGGNIEDYRIRA